VRRAEALHPAALLIDQDRRIAAEFTYRFANKINNLILILDVSLEQDQPPRAGVAEEGALLRRQRQTG
jgi:hypothetical protein